MPLRKSRTAAQSSTLRHEKGPFTGPFLRGGRGREPKGALSEKRPGDDFRLQAQRNILMSMAFQKKDNANLDAVEKEPHCGAVLYAPP